MLNQFLIGIAYAQTNPSTDEDLNLVTFLVIGFGLFFVVASFYYQKKLDAKLKEKLNSSYKIDERKLRQPVESFNVESYVPENPTTPNTPTKY